LYPDLFKSLQGTSIEVEFVFAGNVAEIEPFWKPDNVRFSYYKTADIKPTQIYEYARRLCIGELISWTADDATFPDDVLGKAYRFFKQTCTRKDIISTQTSENYHGEWRLCDGKAHRFFGGEPNAPKMAPMGIMNREYFQELGGIDRRFICGQWDNDLVMRLYNDGGKMYHFNEGVILLDHANKHDKRWGIKDRPFAKGYPHDRAILEGAWGIKGQMQYDGPPFKRYDNGFEPFEDTELSTKTQSFNIKELFHD
jgi:hypothetical protein